MEDTACRCADYLTVWQAQKALRMIPYRGRDRYVAARPEMIIEENEFICRRIHDILKNLELAGNQPRRTRRAGRAVALLQRRQASAGAYACKAARK